MASSGGGGDGGLSSLIASRAANPMPGLPVAGSDSSVGDPYKYGKFQSFLPDIQASGENPSATGLRPEMFDYKPPSSGRDQLAQLQASAAPAPAPAPAAPAAPQGNPQWAALRAQMSPQDIQIFQRSVSPAEFAAFMAS